MLGGPDRAPDALIGEHVVALFVEGAQRFVALHAVCARGDVFRLVFQVEKCFAAVFARCVAERLHERRGGLFFGNVAGERHGALGGVFCLLDCTGKTLKPLSFSALACLAFLEDDGDGKVDAERERAGPKLGRQHRKARQHDHIVRWGKAGREQVRARQDDLLARERDFAHL